MNIFDKLKIGDIVVYSYKWNNNTRDYSYGEVTEVTEVNNNTEVTIKDILCYRKTNNTLTIERPITDTIEGDSYKGYYTFFAINDDRFNESMGIQEFISTIEVLFPEHFI